MQIQTKLFNSVVFLTLFKDKIEEKNILSSSNPWEKKEFNLSLIKVSMSVEMTMRSKPVTMKT